jgi:hypothetical protein
MLICSAVHAGDIEEAIRLFKWIAKLSGSLKQHDCLLVADPATPFDRLTALRDIAESTFGEVALGVMPESVKGWPDGPCAAFRCAAEYVQKHWPVPFLWLEADCVPLKATWLDEIQAASESNRGMFLGHVYDAEGAQVTELGPRFMSGVAVYPPTAFSILKLPLNSPRAWDVENAELMLLNGAHTPLIRHFWGQPKLPPTFVRSRNEHTPINAFTLDAIPAEAVLFHRNKDGSLIRLLERKMFPDATPKEKIVVVFPVHNGDIGLAVRHAEWMVQMGVMHEHEALVSHDPSCDVIQLNRFEALLRKSFSQVDTIAYARPPFPRYPAAANWAFQNCAVTMNRGNSPWLWFEADAVALKPDWIEQIQAEYDRCGASFAGPHVKGMAHSNGVMVYPSNACEVMRTAMTLIDQGAFDYTGCEDYMHDCANIGHLLDHCWTILNDEKCEVGGGEVPARMSLDQAKKWIKPSAVMWHRIKSTDLTNLLMSGAYRHE